MFAKSKITQTNAIKISARVSADAEKSELEFLNKFLSLSLSEPQFLRSFTVVKREN